jgi:hypothetical protein
MTSRPLMLSLLGGVLGALVLWTGFDRLQLKPQRDALGVRLASATERVQTYEQAIDGRRSLERDMDALIARTLGSDVESVDHRLRSRLGRIAEETGLSAATINTGNAAIRQSPARQLFQGRTTLMREMRDQPDFIELDGTVSAEGTLDQVVRLIDRIDAEPWIKRITSLRIDPKQNGERFGVTLRLATLFVPDKAPSENPTPKYDQQRLTRFASVAHANPFRLPPPGRPAQPSPRPGPAEFPYAQWVLTGVAHGRGGDEAWLRNGDSGESRRLAAGERIGEASFVAAHGDSGEFLFGETRFFVLVGWNLSHRTPVNK